MTSTAAMTLATMVATEAPATSMSKQLTRIRLTITLTTPEISRKIMGRRVSPVARSTAAP